jgi:hypothetical protein
MITKESTNSSYMVLLKDNKGNLEKIAFPHPVQVGLSNIPKELILTGRVSVSIGDYKCRLNGSITIDENHTIANISPLSPGPGFLYVKLPITPREGQLLIVKDLSGVADTNNIIVSSWDASTKIDSTQNKVISKKYGYLGFFWSGNSWHEFSGSGGDAQSSGNTILNGPANPPSSLGNVGDFYINTASKMLFGPKTADGWGLGVSLVGPAGLSGPQGSPGSDGIDGLSAYQIWLSEGNSGTQAEFLNSLIGPQGPQGEAPNLIAGDNIVIEETPEGIVISSTATGTGGAINEIFYQKGELKGAIQNSLGVIDFSSIGSLLPGYDPDSDIDVYLNGRLLTQGVPPGYIPGLPLLNPFFEVLSSTTLKIPYQLNPTDDLVVRIATAKTSFVAGSGISVSSNPVNGQVTISSTSTVQNIQWNERLVGAIDGTNTQFELQYTPTSPESIMVFLNGVCLERGAGEDFLISGKIVTLSTPPQIGSKVTATYSR